MHIERLFPIEFEKALRRQKYQLIGRHSATKKCRWFHRGLVEDTPCYKHKFYGVESWRCIQMTPAIAHCTMHCMFCWRVQPREVNVSFNETSLTVLDDPSKIVDGCIEAQRRILTGYKAHPKINKDRYNEALEPKHAAISLAGEPTIYPRLGELNSEFQNRGFTTFIVTNGTKPNILQVMESEPTQLYVSLCAPDIDSFNSLCRPQIPKAWTKLNQTLELLSSFDCPTVLRLTLVKGLNMKHLEKYARLIDKTNPTYIETKAYVFVGYSRKRLSFNNMPIHKEIQYFADELSKLISYNIIDESRASRVVLLSRVKKVKKYN